MQNSVVGVVKEQKQLLGQGRVALQVPLQAKPLGSFRNCRAESVPAQRTAETIAVKSMVFILLLMLGLPFC